MAASANICALAVDRAKLYALDERKGMIDIHDSTTLQHVRSFGTSPSRQQALSMPSALALLQSCSAEANEVVVCDHGRDRCVVFSADGAWNREFGRHGVRLTLY